MPQSWWRVHGISTVPAYYPEDSWDLHKAEDQIHSSINKKRSQAFFIKKGKSMWFQLFKNYQHRFLFSTSVIFPPRFISDRRYGQFFLGNDRRQFCFLSLVIFIICYNGILIQRICLDFSIDKAIKCGSIINSFLI